MSLAKGKRLENVIRSLQSQLNNLIDLCIITNERGLIMATLKSNPREDERAAAMISLASDTAYRVASNIEIGSTNTIKIVADEGTFFVSEFLVNDRRFRIGAIMKKGTFREIIRKGRRFFWRKTMTEEDLFREAAEKARMILED